MPAWSDPLYLSDAWVMRCSLVSLFLQLSFTAATPVREAAIFICGRPRARCTHHSCVGLFSLLWPPHLRPTFCFASLGDTPAENVQQVKRHCSTSGRDARDDFSSDRYHLVSRCSAVGCFYLKFKRLTREVFGCIISDDRETYTIRKPIKNWYL